MSTEASELVAEIMVSMAHVDDWSMGYGTELSDLDEWEQAAARGAAREILSTLLPQISRDILAEKSPITASPGSLERSWQLGYNKGMSDAANIVESEL